MRERGGALVDIYTYPQDRPGYGTGCTSPPGSRFNERAKAAMVEMTESSRSSPCSIPKKHYGDFVAGLFRLEMEDLLNLQVLLPLKGF